MVYVYIRYVKEYIKTYGTIPVGSTMYIKNDLPIKLSRFFI